LIAVAADAIRACLEPAERGVDPRQRFTSHLEQRQIEIVAVLGIHTVLGVGPASGLVPRPHVPHQISNADGQRSASVFEQRPQLRGAS
jgi:hypothetical protein